MVNTPHYEVHTSFTSIRVYKVKNDLAMVLFNKKRNRMKETLEEAIERLFIHYPESSGYIKAALIGKEWQQERSYSEEEVYYLMDKREHYWVRYKNYYAQSYIPFDEWFEKFKKK